MFFVLVVLVVFVVILFVFIVVILDDGVLRQNLPPMNRSAFLLISCRIAMTSSRPPSPDARCASAPSRLLGGLDEVIAILQEISKNAVVGGKICRRIIEDDNEVETKRMTTKTTRTTRTKKTNSPHRATTHRCRT